MTVPATSAADLQSQSVRSLYDQLIIHLKDLTYLNSVSGILRWDQEVMMPKKAAGARAAQLSTLAGVAHEKKTSPILGALLEELEHRKTTEDLSAIFNSYELANIRLAQKDYKEKTVLPSDIVKSIAALNSKAVIAWVEARKESEFSKFAPYLQDQVNVLRQKVAYMIKGGVCEEARKMNEKARASLGLTEPDECYKGYYQVLLDGFEPGFKDDRLQALFSDLKEHLVPLIAKIQAKNFQHDNSYIVAGFDVKQQIEFTHRISKQIGFDTDAGRLDVSTHPFTGGAHPTDVRMTTRYTIDNFKEGITATVHETGHSLYEQGRSKEYRDTPVSRERMVMLSKPFWTYALPLLKEQFADHQNLQNITVDQSYNAFNRVKPGFIRFQADEVTYPMHIILRYEIEKALIEGDIQ
ncbi:hypothetical protein BG015_004110, partial [Linnemannia schmuckeri]